MGSLFFDIMNALLQVDAASDCASGLSCPASALHAVTAAFATQGYYGQADLLRLISTTSFGNWAIFIYVIAFIGGIIGFAIGSPPRIYLWFLIGPVLYDYLINTTEPANGVRHMVGQPEATDGTGLPPQEDVWRIAEPGLRNTNYINDLGISVSAVAPPQGGAQPYSDRNTPPGQAEVSSIFLWWDSLVSSSVQWMIHWFGVDRYLSSNAQGGQWTNLASCPDEVCNPADKRVPWDKMARVKWQLLENITQARFHDPMMRDAFIVFMSGECGDGFVDSLDTSKLIAASNTSFSNAGEHVFLDAESGDYKQLVSNLQVRVPVPFSLRQIFKDVNKSGSFSLFDGVTGGLSAPSPNLNGQSPINYMESITCHEYLEILMRGFRWEAGHIYHQLVNSFGADFTPQQVLYGLFYGWATPGHLTVEAPNGPKDEGLGDMGLGDFAYSLILLHLIRNEFDQAPSMPNGRIAYSKETENYTEAYSKTLGSKSKFGEWYTWSQLIEYVQAIFLYYLALAFPFACMVIIIPGYHKTIFTWMAFWAWVKLWDVGFALVMIMERSLWAMFANSEAAFKVNYLVSEMFMWGQGLYTTVQCTTGSDFRCAVPNVYAVDFVSGGLTGVTQAHYALLDRALVLSSSLRLDLTNGWYITIYAAALMAVPAITGQVVLAGKAGASSFVGQMIGGLAQSAGGQAIQSFQGGASNRMNLTAGAMRNEAQAKSLRASGLGAKVLEMGNAQMTEGFAGGALGQSAEGINRLAQARGMGYESYQKASGVRSGIEKGLRGAAAQYAQQASAQKANGNVGRADAYNAAAGVLDGMATAYEGGAALGAAQQYGVSQLMNSGDPELQALGKQLSGMGGAGGAALPAAGAAGGGRGAAGPLALGAGAAGMGSGGGGGGGTARGGLPAAGAKTAAPASGTNNAPNSGKKKGAGSGTWDAFADAFKGSASGFMKNPDVAAGLLAQAATAGAEEIGDYKQWQRQAGARLDALGQSGDLGMAAFRSQQMAQGYSAAQGRAQSSAQYASQTATWAAQANYASAMGGKASVAGLFAGSLGQAEKSSEFAAGGLLGSRGNAAFGFADGSPNSGFFRGVESGYAQLRGSYGSGSVNEQMKIWGTPEAGRYNVTAGGGGVLRTSMGNTFPSMTGSQFASSPAMKSGRFSYDSDKAARPFK